MYKLEKYSVHFSEKEDDPFAFFRGCIYASLFAFPIWGILLFFCLT